MAGPELTLDTVPVWNAQPYVALAVADSDRAMAAWAIGSSPARNIHWVLLSATGAILVDAAANPIGEYTTDEIAVGGADAGFLVSMANTSGGGFTAICRFDRDGNSSEAPRTVIGTQNFTTGTAVTWASGKWSVFERGTLHGLFRVPAAGAGITSGTLVYVLNSTGSLAAASDGQQTALVWREGIFNVAGIRLLRFEPDGGMALPEVTMGVSKALEDPTVAFGAGEFFVAWREASDGGSSILGTRVADGGLLDANPLVLSDALADQFTPAITFDGQQFLLTWFEGGEVWGEWVSPLGVPGAATLLTDGGASPRQKVAATSVGHALLSYVSGGLPRLRVLGSDGGPPPSDAGLADAGADDAGAVDAGDTDAGPGDAGKADGGLADAGDADAGDAGTGDAGLADAGSGEAGLGDGGAPTPRQLGVGCGCAASSGDGLALLALAGALVRRSRRQQRTAGGPPDGARPPSPAS